MMVANETKLAVSGPFDPAAFLEGFTLAARPDAAHRPGEWRLAFPAAPSCQPVGVLARQRSPDDPVYLRVVDDPSDVDSAVRHARRGGLLDGHRSPDPDRAGGPRSVTSSLADLAR